MPGAKLSIPHLDFLLLFILSFFYTQGHLWVAASTFDRNLFPIYFTLTIFYLLISLHPTSKSQSQKTCNHIKLILFALIFLITIGKTLYSGITLRQHIPDQYPIHDNPLQLEVASQFLLQGKNPYTENYTGTIQETYYQLDTNNQALYHFVTLPFYLTFSTLLSLPSHLTLGFFDQRLVHILTLLISSLLIFTLVKPPKLKITFLTLFLFNPLFIHFFIEGRNDIFVFTWIFLAATLLFFKRYKLASLSFALAFASKQSSWLLLPFFFFYLYRTQNPQLTLTQRFKQVFIRSWPFFLATALFYIPFLLWDAQSFIEDIYLFPGGGLPTSYAITGYGFSQLMVTLGIIRSSFEYFPFWIPQLVFAIPVMIYFLFRIKKTPTISLLLFGYGTFLFIFWIFSRFFVDSYVGYLSMIYLIASLFAFLEEKPLRKSRHKTV